MKKLIIEGNRELSGTIRIGGAKNSVVALIPASLLSNGVSVIKNVPDISDVHILIETMEYLGSKIVYENETLTIDNSNIVNKPIPAELASKIRASYYFMSSLMGKYKHVNIPCPGGCVIGSRPIDFTINSLEKMGVNIEEDHGTFDMNADKLTGKDILLDFASVGATVNIMIAGVLAEGTTRIINAAEEPEIENLADYLNSMGAKITGAGTSKIEIEGVSELGNGNIEVIPDRIEAGTYLIVGALLGKDLEIKNVNTSHMDAIIYKLKEAGVDLRFVDKSIIVNRCPNLKPINIKTTVYPGFPTDLGQPMSTLLTQCEGECLFEETIYENRLRHIPHLNSMGANIKAFEKNAVINGKTNLSGRPVVATDLRAGASMLVAGMIADGKTTIKNIEHLLRGYERLVEKLNNVGGNIKYIDN